MPANKWDFSPKEAIALQNELRKQVRIEPLEKPVRTIAGADVSLNMFAKEIFAGIIVFSYPELVPLEYSVVRSETSFPYIPGLLSFREIPALLECYKKIKQKPGLIMVDGQGIAHPRRLGIASHLGVLLDVPTIGCAKSILYGKPEAGRLSDPKTGEPLGFVYDSKSRSNPLIISPGHRVSVGESLTIVKQCLKGYRLPEPTRLAHKLVNDFRLGLVQES